jgi:tRNA A-37 threonylcarbamoyl transferase component Bud32
VLGTRINNYQIVSLLGEGGMGAVYLAEHPLIGRKAAIKILRQELAEDPQLVERFMNEARAANAIRHPHIIDIIDVGRLPSGLPYLMMELLEGESLAKRITRQALLVADAADIACQTAEALAAAHGKGIVHRDLKPDNLFLVADDVGALSRVKVLDFGIAKLRGDLSGRANKTMTGSILGTPPYMSPEQCRGNSDDVDHRTDIYSLGIILYEMLMGTPPFVSNEWLDIAFMHLNHQPPSVRARNSDTPEALDAVIQKALAKNPSDRWTSMAEMAATLRAAVPAGAPRGLHLSGAISTSPAAGSPAAGNSGGTALLPASPTTLGSATGQIGQKLDFETAAGAYEQVAPAPYRRLRLLTTAAVSVATLVVIVVVARRSAGPMSIRAASAPAHDLPANVWEPSEAPVNAAKAIPPSQGEAATLPEPNPSRRSGDVRAASSSVDETRRRADPVPQGGEEPSGAIHDATMPGPQRAAVTTGRPKASHQSRQATPLALPPPPRTKPGCDTNFTFDVEGNKHFKPECF